MVEIMSSIPTWLIDPLLLGFILDILLGDPRWLPHPIRWFGKWISWWEKKMNSGKSQFAAGAFLVVISSICLFISLFIIELFLSDYDIAKLFFESIMVFYGLANRSLIGESYRVERELINGDLLKARQQLNFIVGRDTHELNENQIRTATLETLSENLSDGVIAPLFYYAIGGIPLMFVYKLVNTFDSMIGYKNERYIKFGKFAAKLDDVMNFIPARLTAVLMTIVSFSWRGFYFIFKYGRNHSSPNAGYPEAALSGILNSRFGGPNYYSGKLIEKPYIGIILKKLSFNDFIRACVVNVLVALAVITFQLLMNNT